MKNPLKITMKDIVNMDDIVNMVAAAEDKGVITQFAITRDKKEKLEETKDEN